MTDPARELRHELVYLKDSLISSIREGRTGEVDIGLDMYAELVRTFVARLTELGSRYDKATALQELTSIGDDWSEIRWIEEDLYQLIESALASGSSELIRNAIWLPVRLARIGFDHFDYYTFHKFVQKVGYCYVLARELRDPRSRQQAVDLCSRYLSEQANWIMGPAIERAESPQAVETRGDFALGVEVVFSRLLKAAYDHREIADFRLFVSSLSGLFDFYLKHPPDYGREEGSLSRAHAQLAHRLLESKALIFFGLGAWILHGYLEKDLNAAEWEDWNQSLRLPQDLDTAWRLLLQARRHETQQEMGWSHWELEEQEDGGAIIVQFGAFVARYFCVLAIEMLASGQGGNWRPKGEEVGSLARPSGGVLRNVLSDMAEHRERWGPVIGENGIEAIPLLEDILDHAFQSEKRREAEQIISAPLSGQRVDAVKNNIVREWRRDATLRTLAEAKGDYRYKNEPGPEGMLYLGINTRDLKELYIEQDRLFSGQWGEDYGRALARGENNKVLNSLISAGRPHAETVTIEDPAEQLAASLDSLRDRGHDPIILLSSFWRTQRTLIGSPLFSPEEEPLGSILDLVGLFSDARMFELSSDYEEEFVLLLDLRRTSTWQQYRPKLTLPGEEYLTDELTFYLGSIDQERARQMVRDRPELVPPSGEKTEEEVLLELQQQVHIRVWEQFDFEVRVPEEVRLLILPEE